jgi:hypothetical protein
MPVLLQRQKPMVCLLQRKPEMTYESNPSSVSRGIVDSYSYSTLSWITWEVVTVVGGILRYGLLRHMLANGALVYPTQGGRYRAEVAWHWGGDFSVVNDPLGEPGRTPLYTYVGLLPGGAPWTVTKYFPLFRGRAPYWGL